MLMSGRAALNGRSSPQRHWPYPTGRDRLMSSRDRFCAIARALVLCALALGPVLPAAAGRESRPTCEIEPGVPDSRLLLFGELHGSREIPELVGRVACTITRDSPVAVGLELPASDEPLIDRYLHSAGTAADKRRLTASAFWQQSRDGRSSDAMLGLIEQIRQLRKSGAPVTLFAFEGAFDDPSQKTTALAEGIRAFRRRHPGMRIVALRGRGHVQSWSGAMDGKPRPTTASLLHDLAPTIVQIRHPAGTAWNCSPDCGIHEVAGSGRSVSSGFGRAGMSGDDSRIYQLKSITASLPATRQVLR